MKNNFLKNQFPPAFLKAVKKNFIEKVNITRLTRRSNTISREREVLLILHYLKALLESFEKRLKSIISSAGLKIVFRTTFRIADLCKIKIP